MKRQVIDCENLFAKHGYDNGLVSRIYKKCLKPNNKISNPIKKWTKDFNRHFKDDGRIANKHKKICSTSLANREIETKTSGRYHFTPIRMAIRKNTINK